MKKTVLLWVLAFIITLASAYYQRRTGPTYPIDGNIYFEGQKINYHLDRSHEGSDSHVVKIFVPDNNISGFLKYRRYKSNDSYTEVSMKREGNNLQADFPAQPPAGEIQYYIKLTKGMSFANVPEEAVVLRYKDPVPLWLLVPHIFIMFAAMLFSTRAGLESLSKNSKSKNYVIWTFTLLVLGGLILGAIVQKFAFGSYWTGFPFGFDLTDNKTAIAILAWLAALIASRKEKPARAWVLAASIILLVVYLIPHSILGSEIDYTKSDRKVEAPIK